MMMAWWIFLHLHPNGIPFLSRVLGLILGYCRCRETWLACAQSLRGRGLLGFHYQSGKWLAFYEVVSPSTQIKYSCNVDVFVSCSPGLFREAFWPVLIGRFSRLQSDLFRFQARFFTCGKIFLELWFPNFNTT